MLDFLKRDSRLGFLSNVLVVGLIFTAVLLLFFYVYLPITTNHGELLTVPDVKGKSRAEMVKALNDLSLRYEIIDSITYNDDFPTSTVVSQLPKADAQVKINRKIYITLNPAAPPSVTIPKNIISNSIRNAKEQLRIAGLTVDKVKEVPNRFRNVIAIEVNGKELSKTDILKGHKLQKGQAVNLIVGDGDSSLGLDGDSLDVVPDDGDLN